GGDCCGWKESGLIYEVARGNGNVGGGGFCVGKKRGGMEKLGKDDLENCGWRKRDGFLGKVGEKKVG
ncbi:hypothetical protein, partial [Bacillus subtilis]|uniref:hypothetical protein n=1 Tax=Bacillus subtilis TaxID=1423 RepID=UPI001BDB9CAD